MTLEDAPMTQQVVPHAVTILLTGDTSPDFRTARALLIDGKELLLPSETTVKVEVGDKDSMTVTLTIHADVEFRRVPFYMERDEDGCLVSFALTSESV